MSGRPRLLFISPRFLFPMDEGGKIRTANILRRMKGGAFEIVLASPAPPGVERRFAAEIAGCCDRFLGWPPPRTSRLRRFLALAGPLPVSVAADRSNEGARVVAAALADRPDVVVADFPHAAVLLPPRIEGASVLFTHNVEVEIYERHAAAASGPWRLLWRDQARRMERFEREACRRFRTVIAVSARDAALLRSRFGPGPVERIDTGVDLDFFSFTPPSDRPSPSVDGGTVVFTGALDSAANVDGLRFFIREVWPLVARSRPAARALIVGRNPTQDLLALARDLPFTFTGFVDDIRPHLASGDVSVIPLRVGSGTRIKAFEAMAMGIPVVSTRLGVEGLDIEAGEHFLAADDPAAFAAAILGLLGDAGLRSGVAAAARARLEQRFSWGEVARQFEAICEGARAGADARRAP